MMKNKSSRRGGGAIGKKKGLAPPSKPQQRPLWPQGHPKIRRISNKLKELEDEKAKIEQMIRLLKIKKGAKGAREQQQQQQQQSVAAALVANNNNKNHKNNEEGSESPTPPSDISSLNSRAVDDAVMSKQRDDDDISVMTENIYHYDARGRKINDDDYGAPDSETVIAHFQNGTGHCQPTNPTSSSTHKKQTEGAVVIEWKRGKSYQPNANLPYDDVLHQHPTDVSLMVGDDKSFYDELSLSSGEDSILAVAFTDMPMQIELDPNNLGSDDVSISSDLHSECSISVAAQPVQRTKSSSKDPLRQALVEAPPASLYQRTQALDHSDHSDSIEKPSRRRRRKATEPPPPLTSDMSHVDDQQQPEDDDEPPQPPIEISFSEKSMSGVESLGSELCGASLSKDTQQHQPTSKSKSTNKAVVESNNDTKKNKNKPKKSTKSSSKEAAVKDNILGDRDSETEENELSAGALNFTKEELMENGVAINNHNTVKSPVRTAKKTTTTATKVSNNHNKKSKRCSAPSEMSLHSSMSSMAASGVDTEACVAAPRRASLSAMPKNSNTNTAATTKNGSKAKAATHHGATKQDGEEEEDLKRQNSNSTCNSSLTSLPGVMDNSSSNRGLVIEGAALVKQKS